jgi:hypothetical protein
MLAGLLLAAMALAPAAAAKPVTSTGVSVPVSYTDATGSFTGSFDITRFANQGGALVAVGTLTGDVTNALGQVVGITPQALTLPVIDLTGTCAILHLELGPLDLTLLGLAVHLDKIVLDITAHSGPGNLLGNLLCGIAGLLDSNGALSAIARVLNQILVLLG